MRCPEDAVRLDLSEHPEFDLWQWVDYWYPLHAVVAFKRHVYWRALHELAPFLSVASSPRRSSAVRSIESVLCDSQDREAWSSPIRSRSLESPRGPTGIQQVTVLQMRQMENTQNPVITRMVVTTRRCGLEKAATPALDFPDAVVLDDSREVRPPHTAAASRHR
jgi:hypothetical protein